MSNKNFACYITIDGALKTLAGLYDGKPFTITNESHIKFDDVLDLIRGGKYDEAAVLIGDKRYLVEYIKQIKGLVYDENSGTITFNGERLYGKLVDTITNFISQNIPFQYLWNFLNNLMENPSEHSRKQLYTFLENYHLPITPEGYFIAYKAVTSDYLSTVKGYGIVNGKKYENAYLSNKIGSVVELPREKAVDDPSVACSFGLHVGAYEYVKDFHSYSDRRVLLVKVHPRDVVSVPHDSKSSKIRCCKYEVLSEYSSGGQIHAKIDDEVVDQKLLSVGEELFVSKLREAVDKYKSRKSKLPAKFFANLVDECALNQAQTDRINELLLEIVGDSVDYYRYHAERLLEQLRPVEK